MTEERKYHRSFSQLKLYTACSERFRLKKMVRPRLPEQPAAWNALGNAIHDAYYNWEYSGRHESLPELFGVAYGNAIADQIAKQPDLNSWQRTPRVKTTEQDIKLRGDAGHEQAVKLEKTCLAAPWRVWELPETGLPALELEFTVELGGVTVVGAIDRVLEWENGQVTPEDFKTGNKKNTVGDNRQLGLYGYVVQHYFDVDCSRARYWYTKLNEAGQWVNLDRYTEKYLGDQFRVLDDAIGKRIFLPNPGEQCDFCEVQKWCSEKGSEKA